MTVYQYEAVLNNGETKSLSDYEGKVLLIVNTASKCGFTPQYKELQELYEQYREDGLEILAFPCNQFMNQEPGTDAEILEFCSLNYGVTFPIFSKIDVNGDQAHPLYKYLCKEAPGLMGSKAIKWNFTKFLVNRKGEVVKRVASNIKPSECRRQIEALLKG
ncbi:glutathione peroxidase [Paenactinomyces guangxiensis]|uniref:Glutathione peroxidase n=1 Tax=Paenactinomyces guangxiensis TaxID=1490290 RepID=A0A7W1WRF1_9BACL|nr:glutathione peroxidase [Paenactinomyces guangxiensis]MBA4494695.1 glutathione peroxidase [Paenactinomyces guangxiensis]MBH8591779.1 glutathione peroxidase [Paenactinomyces guangxiensis]